MAVVSQTDAVLEHLKKHKGITSIEAINLYGATRLAAIIFCLRKKYNIITVTHETTNRFGKTTHYAEYRLVEDMGSPLKPLLPQ